MSRLEELVAQLGDQDGVTRRRARETLAAIGEAAVPSLVELLGSHQDRSPWTAPRLYKVIALDLTRGVAPIERFPGAGDRGGTHGPRRQREVRPNRRLKDRSSRPAELARSLPPTPAG
jgi:hypothetical protein